MHGSNFNLGESGSEQLVARRPESETPEFDITAMVDLVFMMNIYFLVTFITVALGELNLPTAKHVRPFDPEEAVIFTLTRTLDGKSITLYLGNGDKGEAVTDQTQQEKRIRESVEQGKAAGKTAVLVKAEKKVRLTDLFRVATAATADGLKLHLAVLEKDK
jgi:biopolymer transport protein ExbD